MRIDTPVPPGVKRFFCILLLLACAVPGPAAENASGTAADHAERTAADEAMAEADRLADEGDFNGAADAAGRALEIRRRVLGGDDPLTLTAMSDRGFYLQRAGELEAAEPLLREALAGRRRVLGNDHEETLASLTDLFRLLRERTNFEEAEPLIREASETARRVLGPESETTAELLGELAQLFISLGRYPEAEAVMLEALEADLDAHGEATPLSGYYHYNLGTLYYRWGKLEQSLEHFDLALAAYIEENGPDDPATLTAVLNRANVLVPLGRLEEAERDLRRGLEGRRALYGDDHPRTLTALNNLGFCCNNQGRYPEAEDCFRECLARYRRRYGDENTNTLLAMLNLGHVLKKQWRLPEADALLRRALTGYRDVYGDDNPRTVTALHNLASLLEAQGRLEEAEAAYLEVLEGRRKLLGEDSPRTITVLNNLGLVANKQGDAERAEALFREALAARRQVLGDESHQTLNSMDNLGMLLLEQGRLEEAGPLIREALAGREEVLGEVSPPTVLSRLHLGRLLDRQGRLEEAEPLLREAVEDLKGIFGDAHIDTAASLSRLAAHYYRRGDLPRTTAVLTEAAAVFEAARLRAGAGGLDRVHFAAGNSPLTPLAACLARAGKPLEAWQRFEAGLARGLLDTVSARRSRPLTGEEQRREADLLRRLSRLDERLGRLYGEPGFAADEERKTEAAVKEKERDELLDQLARFQAEVIAKYGPAAGEVYDLERIQSRMPEGAVLVGWVDVDGDSDPGPLGGEHWACLVRDSGPPLWVALPGSGTEGAWTADDRALPGRLREALGRRARGAAARHRLDLLLRQLRTQRLDPLVPHLEGIERLVVLPAGRMAGIPVEALTDEYTVSYAPSGTMFAWLREREAGTAGGGGGKVSPLLALGDPVFTRAAPAEAEEGATRAAPPPGPERQARYAELTPLPGTRDEVQAIAGLFAPPEGQPGPVVLLGSEASEQRLEALSESGRLGTFRYIHLATHGVMDDEVAMRSALVLAQDGLGDAFERAAEGKGVYDGWLTGEQIVRSWSIGAELVTLSGCETALGREAGGEGFLGFSQALFVAGARSLVLSLWKVDDRATMLLMQRFYENLLGRFPEPRALPGAEFTPGNPMPRAEALREAKTWLRQFSPEGRTDHPYAAPRYWAAFILLGDPE